MKGVRIMNQRLVRLLWRKHQWFLFLFVSGIFLFFLFCLNTDLKGWQSDWGSEIQLEKAAHKNWDENEEDHLSINNKSSLADQDKVFYYDIENSRQGEKLRWQSNYYAASIHRFLLLFIGIGVFLLFSLDNLGKFNQFLFSSIFSRKRIYLVKIISTLLIVLTAVSIGMGLYHYLFINNVPASVFNDQTRMIMKSNIVLLIKTAWMVLFSSFLGIVCQKAFMGLLLLIFLWQTGGGIFPSLLNLFYIIGGHTIQQQKWFSWTNNHFYQIFDWRLIRLERGIAQMICYLLLSLIIGWISLYCYQRISLENSRSFLVFPKYRKRVWWGLVGYCVFLQVSSGFFYTSPSELSGVSPDFGLLFLSAFLTILVAAPIFYLIIYQKIPFRHRSIR